MSDGLEGMSEGKDYRLLHIAFLFGTALLDRGIGMLDRSLLKTGHTSYSNLLHKVYRYSRNLSWTEVQLHVPKSKTGHFKRIVLDKFPSI